MINYKKEQLIKKHLGANTPKWIIDNCIALINEFEEIEWLKVPQEQANVDNSEREALHIDSVMPSLHTFKERRDKLNLTLRQVAEQTKVSAATISRIEREEGLCSYHNVVQLDDYYCRNGA